MSRHYHSPFWWKLIAISDIQCGLSSPPLSDSGWAHLRKASIIVCLPHKVRREGGWGKRAAPPSLVVPSAPCGRY
eukprot:3313054-Pleurochrysis_carterae.AAC.1